MNGASQRQIGSEQKADKTINLNTNIFLINRVSMNKVFTIATALLLSSAAVQAQDIHFSFA